MNVSSKILLPHTGININSVHVITGGIDKQYSFVAGSDIRKDNLISGAKYRIQATHPSVNASFDDTLSFVVASNSSSTTIVRVCIVL